ncbi:RidA family protein [Pseudonocardia spinosispora]|uniref:RidA family protein n=1 Tax=Pseudonocardia spinosispora TaxID=103441 RepID=UPI000420C3D1|nr:RidA family protein [Pseudonocardia spinosispora]
MAVERINPATLAPPIMDLYSQVVLARGTRHVRIAGQVAIDVDGNLVGEGDYAAQARQAWLNIRCAVEAVGGTGHDITRYSINVVDHRPELVEDIYRAGAEVFGDEFPKAASTLLGVQALALPGWLIEIEAEAILD